LEQIEEVLSKQYCRELEVAAHLKAKQSQLPGQRVNGEGL